MAPLSMGFSRKEYCSGMPFPSPGDLPEPGIEPGSPALRADALPSEPNEGVLRASGIDEHVEILNDKPREGMDAPRFSHTLSRPSFCPELYPFIINW